MYKLTFFCFFLFATGLLKAGDLPKLNLEIGKKYTIETIFHEDTSKTNPRREYDKKIFEFVPTSLNKDGIYDINLTISYYIHVRQEISLSGAWTEKEIYETGYVTTHRNPTVYLNMFKIPVNLKIAKNNKITSFDFSEYNKTKTPEGLPLSLGDWDQKSLQSEISALFFDPEKTHSSWSHEMDIRSKYRVISEDESSLEVEVDNNEKAVPKGETGSNKEQFRRNILIDKSTGLILEDNLSFVWNFMGKRNVTRYQKWIPEFSEKFEANQKKGESKYEKTWISNPNTAIRVTVQDSNEFTKYIYITFYDVFKENLRTSFRIEKDKIGVFNFRINFNEPHYMSLQFSPETVILPGLDTIKREWVYLSPGDNLELFINTASHPNKIVFRGIGAEENKLINMISILKPSRGYMISDRTFGSTLSTVNSDSVFQILNKYKSSVNPDFYLYVGNTLLYKNKYGVLSNSTFNNIKIPVCNSLALRNIIYMVFLSHYVVSFKSIINKSSTNYKWSIDGYEEEYNLGLILLAEPVLCEYLGWVVERALLRGRWENAKLLFERYKLTYSNNPRFKQIEQIYQQQALFAPGSPFPLEKLTDIHGNTISLQEIKDKLVVIITIPLPSLAELGGIGAVKSLTRGRDERYNNTKEIIFVKLIIGTNDHFTLTKLALDEKSDEKIVFLNVYDIPFGKIPLSPLINRRTCILGRDGIILYDRAPTYTELQKAIEDLKNPVLFHSESNYFLKIVAFSLLGILIILGLAFLVYRQVSKRKLKRAELSRKMRELELTVIRTQMNPHFMYNCLNSIQNLVQKNQNEKAFTYLSKFASLVRQTLNNSKKDEIPLSKELDSVKEYIELEQLRFDFDYKIELAEGIDADGIFVPPMLLQPFVENALLHGLLLKKGSRMLVIRIIKDQSKITLVVEDNGVGRDAAGKSERKGNGQGILLCRNRLSLLSEKTGIHFDLKIDDLTDENLQPSGTRVSVGFVEQE